MSIIHDRNGPFVRASHDATPEGQSERVYAVEATYTDGRVDYWDVHPDGYRTQETIEFLHRHYPGVRSRKVTRTVTITASEWEEVQ